MGNQVDFRCGGCQARLRAEVRLVGRSGPCPSCGHKVRVPPQIPEEAGPVLVMDDGSWQDTRVARWNATV